MAGDAAQSPCPLCDQDGGQLVWRDQALRVILADEPDFPGFTRVIWGTHVREMTDLSEADRDHLMAAVYAVEKLQIRCFNPLKINLASLGNQVDHLHWHVIPRFAGDSRFPAPVWAAAQRDHVTGLPDAAQLRRYSDALARLMPG